MPLFIPLLLLSVSPSAVTSTSAPYLGVASRVAAEGERVTRIASEGPAARAGLEVGDVVLAIDGRPLGPHTSLPSELSRYRAGDVVRLSTFTHGAVTERRVQLGALPATALRADLDALQASPAPSEPDRTKLYLTVAAVPAGAAAGVLTGLVLHLVVTPLVCIRAAGSDIRCGGGPITPTLRYGAAIGAGAGALLALGLLLYEPDPITKVDGGPEPSSMPGPISLVPVAVADRDGEAAYGLALRFGGP